MNQIVDCGLLTRSEAQGPPPPWPLRKRVDGYLQLAESAERKAKGHTDSAMLLLKTAHECRKKAVALIRRSMGRT